LVVCDTNTTICFPSGRTELVIGRRDPSGAFAPDIDLARQGGAEKGVSRRHARISCREHQVYIEDLESHNGTYVNQKRLQARQEQRLCDQDTIWVGHLKLVFTVTKDPLA
jgi:pSer/pThr/pTyr-binding forkhead associated (FHA) protein